MFSRANLPLARRLSLVFVIANCFTLASTFILFTCLVFIYSRNSFYQELDSVARVVAATSRAALAFADTQAAQRVLSGLEAKQNIAYATLIDGDGKFLAEFGNKSYAQVARQAESSNKSAWSLDNFIISEPVVLDGEKVGRVVVVAESSELLSQFMWLSLIGAALTFVVAIGAALFSIKLRSWVIEPINNLRELTQQVSLTKDFTTRMATGPLDRNDEIQELISSVHHMLMQLEERDKSLMLAKERAEKADRAKSVFVASMSHELRTPLHAILGISEEVMRTELSSEQSELLHTLKNAGDSLLSVINDILDFSKIEEGRIVLNPSYFYLRNFLDKTLKMFQVQFERKQVRLSHSVAEDVPEQIFADSGRLSQVLINLIGNALKFTSEHGDVHISVTLIGSDPEGQSLLHFSVRDSGIGIAADKLGLIFDAFTQLRQQTEVIEGTGLGLAIVARLTKLMGGKIWVDSKLGEGSIFHFSIEYMPLAVELHEHAQLSPLTKTLVRRSKEVSVTAPVQNKVILIVEDNQVNQKLAQRMVKDIASQVLVASNGLECLKLFSEHEIDLILMDINMPLMDGLEATRQIRKAERERGGHVPIIALTASVTQEDARLCYEAGMDRFLSKPLSRDMLISAICELFSTADMDRVVKMPMA